MQVYAASIMFGYFVRRVDKRFQLERSLGLLPQNQEEAVARLERLFSQVQRPTNPAHGPTKAAQVSVLNMRCHCKSPTSLFQVLACMLLQAEALDGADDPDSPSSSTASSPDASPQSESSSKSEEGPSFSQAQATGDFQALGAEQAKSKKKRIPLRECVLAASFPIFSALHLASRLWKGMPCRLQSYLQSFKYCDLSPYWVCVRGTGTFL